jgi:polysaccharide biosynthesis protein PelE
VHISRSEAHWSAPTGLVAISLVAEVCLVLYGWHYSVGTAQLLLLHAIISALVIAGGLLWFRHGGSDARIALAIVSIVALGPIGGLGCALMDLMRWISSRSSISFEEWYERLFPRALADRSQALYELIEWRGAKPSRQSTVAPFCDVLDLGSVAQKQAVVTLIADHFKPEFSPPLQRALNDPEPAIRVQAATAAARIENNFLQRSIMLQEEHGKDPDDPSIARRIALHHESYAASGLLDLERAASERRIALEINMNLLQASPQDPGLTAAVARLFLELECPQEAIRLLRPWLRAKSIPHALVGPMADALYSLKRLRLLRRISSRLVASLTTDAADDPLRASLRLWIPGHG